jgi:hypothetical protein
MDDKPRRDEKRGGFAIVLLLALALTPVLYVLSVGPASWMWDTGRITEGTFTTVYSPLMYIYWNVPPVRPPLDWYVNLWDQEATEATEEAEEAMEEAEEVPDEPAD